MRRAARRIDRARAVELVNPGLVARRTSARIGLDHLPRPAAARSGRGVEHLLGAPVGEFRAVLRDHPIGPQIDLDMRAEPFGYVRPVESRDNRAVGLDESTRLLARIAEDHRDRLRLRGRIGPEGVPMQMDHIEHGTEIDAAAQNRIGRAQPLDQLFDRSIAHGLRIARVDASFHKERLHPARGIDRPLCGDLLTAHRSGRVEQTRRFRHRHKGRDLRTASGLSEHHDAGRIAAEHGNILANPLQRTDEIELAEIPGIAEPLAHRLQPAIAEHVQPMVDGDNHRIALSGKVRALRQRIGNRAPVVSSAMEIDHHRTPGAAIGVRGPDVEEEAILAHLRGHRIALRA